MAADGDREKVAPHPRQPRWYRQHPLQSRAWIVLSFVLSSAAWMFQSFLDFCFDSV